MEILWVDFNSMGIEGVRLSCNGTQKEIKDKGLVLFDGLKLLVWYVDEYEDGSTDKLSAEVIVKYSDIDKCWVGQINSNGIQLESSKPSE
jgi:hypothetical protein